MLNTRNQIERTTTKRVALALAALASELLVGADVTLDDAVHSGRLTPGALVLLVGFGGGMTWGGVAMRWNPAADLYPCM